MQARFLLGPAGSGKTFRCVEEVRAELLRSPDGPPLIFLAPKQATFQIERQLLSGDALLANPEHRSVTGLAPSPDTEAPEDRRSGLRGYSRLHILSFERLAGFVFERMGLVLPELLSEEGRVMVLRALLARHHAELRVYRASARLTGFAGQLSTVLREVQRSRLSAGALTALSGKMPGEGRLADKLHDLALLLERYEEWLLERRKQRRQLEDTSRLLDLAAEALREADTPGRRLNLGALWLDGFAEMTPQETALMAAMMPHCDAATLAFCLNSEPQGELSWLSPWTVVGRTFAQCREAVAQALRTQPVIEMLPRGLSHSRFAAVPELLALERAWAAGLERGPSCSPKPSLVSDADRNGRTPGIRLVACPNPESEATLAAREILRHVQAGGRFRDCAILVRSLDGYHDVLRRVLGRFEIPFFLDRREAVAHHPLAELTRYALRTVAFDWRQEDWFGALKSGLSGALDAEVDWLENEALKRGWAGQAWRQPLVIADDPKLCERLEAIRRRVMPGFERLGSDCSAAGPGLSGGQLASALRGLWLDLGVEAQLEAWMESADRLGVSGSAHGTVWSQLNDWLENLELAFAGEALPLRDWLPIVEAGLSGMTVGVIPPSLDQVLVGSVDRSRNPDLKSVFVLGVNEGVFPAPPVPGVLLSDPDRRELEAHGVTLGTGQRQQLGHERYLGYIAFTRARASLTVTWAAADEEGAELNPSIFVSAIRRAVPDAVEESFVEFDWTHAMHRVELPRHLLPPAAATGPLAELPEFEALVRRWEQSRLASSANRFSPEVAARLYGKELNSSVSALEDFMACPFRFVAARALRTQEREEFVADARQKGSFQHEVLQEFHERVRAGNRQWRDLSPDEARQWVREIGNDLAQTFQGGLMVADAARRFTTGVLIDNLERLMSTLVSWAPQYGFDPTEVEAGFGLDGSRLPAWSIPLDHGRVLRLRGRIDRVDVSRDADGAAWVVICDYKSGGKEMDPVKIEAGLELQLLSYLAALTRLPEAGEWLNASTLQPAGVFYVPLRARPESGATRVLAVAMDAGAASAFQHRGRFDGALLSLFDRGGGDKGVQFRFKLNKDGALAKRGNDALPPGGFAALVGAAEARLHAVAGSIFNGDAAVEPFRLKQQTACDWCAYRAVCRFDPWTMSFRALVKPGEREV